jgi:hypothetical protein
MRIALGCMRLSTEPGRDDARALATTRAALAAPARARTPRHRGVDVRESVLVGTSAADRSLAHALGLALREQ